MTKVWTSPSSCPCSRYRWLIRPPIHWFAIASLDWIGKSAPVPLQYDMIQVLRLLRRPTHTPSKAGLVQYASYTTKCPGTTSGLSGKQATHDGVHALPPVGTGPAHKRFVARPEEWRDTFRWQSSYTTSVQELSPPPSQLRNKASRHWGTSKHKGTFLCHEPMQGCLEGSRALPHSV